MLDAIPLGLIFFAWCTLMAVVPIRRPRRLAVAGWLFSCAPNELPLHFLAVVVLSTVPALAATGVRRPGDWVGVALVLLVTAGLTIAFARAFRAGPALDAALASALGARWRGEIAPSVRGRLRRRRPWATLLFVPWPIRPRSVARTRNVAYGPKGASNLADVYRHRSRPTGAPVLVHLHGGHFRWGRKSFEGRALLHRLAREGWTCISADYELSRTSATGFPGHLVDVKRVLAWIRSHADELGADPDAVFLAGSSSGAHLTAMAALTANDPRFQPGFETEDTSIAAGIGLYGYYGALGDDTDPPSDPVAYAAVDTPPFFVVHGSNDTYTPVEGARRLVEHLRARPGEPVVLAELPGAQHSFDLFHSVRFEAVVDAIEAFAAWVRTAPGPSRRLGTAGDVGRGSVRR